MSGDDDLRFGDLSGGSGNQPPLFNRIVEAGTSLIILLILAYVAIKVFESLFFSIPFV